MDAHDDTVRALNRLTSTAFDQLRSKFATCPQETLTELKALLEDKGLRDDATISIELLRVAVSIRGVDSVSAWMLSEWPTAGLSLRLRMSDSFYDESVLPAALAVELFNHSSTDVIVRHRLVAALAATAARRRCITVVLALVERIGTYDDYTRQNRLEEFKQSVIASLKPSQ